MFRYITYRRVVVLSQPLMFTIGYIFWISPTVTAIATVTALIRGRALMPYVGLALAMYRASTNA